MLGRFLESSAELEALTGGRAACAFLAADVQAPRVRQPKPRLCIGAEHPKVFGSLGENKRSRLTLYPPESAGATPLSSQASILSPVSREP
jgi:hypothetical protein